MAIQFPLTSARLQVRPFRTEDRTAIHAVYGDPEVMRYVAYGNAVPATESAAMVDDYIQHQRMHGYSFWAVIERSTGRFIGDAGFEARDVGAEFGYTLARQSWGQGLATEVGQLCLAAAFDQLHLPELTAVVDPRNPASARVLDKLGFRPHGECFEYGRPHRRYLITAENWRRGCPSEPIAGTFPTFARHSRGRPRRIDREFL
ncbi:GNAT family N-acetyltransferase [Saccharopolyspora sp. ASAGF58]|uniref:GNAT family N-acetyltransferase n=1 Tax=Saccharopolyspora sp. ASAGF58 TaxID=2719023 RepID=UPI001B308629|nr:GNAT family N-acetyltransferase [Saccharopolyspora sp. ASAGF58]